MNKQYLYTNLALCCGAMIENEENKDLDSTHAEESLGRLIYEGKTCRGIMLYVKGRWNDFHECNA